MSAVSHPFLMKETSAQVFPCVYFKTLDDILFLLLWLIFFDAFVVGGAAILSHC